MICDFLLLWRLSKPLILLLCSPGRDQKFSRSAVNDWLRELLPCLRQCQLGQSGRHFNFDIFNSLTGPIFSSFWRVWRVGF
jgi:hypothetical protein